MAPGIVNGQGLDGVWLAIGPVSGLPSGRMASQTPSRPWPLTMPGAMSLT